MKLPKKLNIIGIEYSIIQDKNENGASFSYEKKAIRINPTYKDHYMLEILIHEISEIIHMMLGNRLFKSENNSYLFLMDHGMFQTHNKILVNTLINNKLLSI